MFYVYIITYTPENKSYVGMSNNPFVRFTTHKYNKRFPIVEEQYKNGTLENLTFKILDKHKDKREAYLLEAEYIKKFNTVKPYGYNTLGTNVGPDVTREGENNSRARIRNVEVVEIREIYARGESTQQELADIYKVSRSSIADIVKGRTYKNVGGTISTENQKFRGGNSQYYKNREGQG